jgi:hypothetical protein
MGIPTRSTGRFRETHPAERLVHRWKVRYRQRVSRCETQSNINRAAQRGRTVEDGAVCRQRRSATSTIRLYVSASGDGAGGLQIVGQLVRLSLGSIPKIGFRQMRCGAPRFGALTLAARRSYALANEASAS